MLDLVCEESFESENFGVKYYLLTNIASERTYYGIKVEKIGGAFEEATVFDVLPSRDETIKIIHLLKDMHVTPITAKDVINDYVEGLAVF